MGDFIDFKQPEHFPIIDDPRVIYMYGYNEKIIVHSTETPTTRWDSLVMDWILNNDIIIPK